MAKGKKLDIFIGANFEDGWNEIQTSQTKKAEILAPKKHFLVFKREKRRGKTVTIIGEFHLKKDDTSALLKKMKKKLGCGGTYKNGWMEFQGEVKEKLLEAFKEEDFKFKH